MPRFLDEIEKSIGTVSRYRAVRTGIARKEQHVMILAFSDFRPAETKMKDEKGTGSFSTLRSSLVTVMDGSRGATLRLEVIPLMIEIEGAQYSKCANCLRWNPTNEMIWDNEALTWVCCDPDCMFFLVV